MHSALSDMEKHSTASATEIGLAGDGICLALLFRNPIWNSARLLCMLHVILRPHRIKNENAVASADYFGIVLEVV
jgi:hypothetical protein